MNRDIIDSAKIVDDETNIQESVNQLELEISKTIENNNEKVKEVQRELEELINEREEASSKILMGEPLKEIEEVLMSSTFTSTVASTSVAKAIETELKSDDGSRTVSKTNEDVVVVDVTTVTSADTTMTTTTPKIDISAKVDLEEDNDGNVLEGIRIDDVTMIPSSTKVSDVFAFWLLSFLLSHCFHVIHIHSLVIHIFGWSYFGFCSIIMFCVLFDNEFFESQTTRFILMTYELVTDLSVYSIFLVFMSVI